MLECRDVTVAFGDVTAVANAAIELPGGKVGALIGPSGSGKSTLLRVIAGLETPDAGVVRWDGDDVTRRPPHRRGFGLMFQDYALFPHLDVAANVAFSLRVGGVDPAATESRVTELLELVGLPGYEDRTIDGLSGGEQQRVALARTLAPAPDLLMLDEPLGALDRSLREELLPEMRAIFHRLGTTVLYVTHDHDEAFAVADVVFVMRDGAVIGAGSPPELWQHPPDLATARFLGFEPVLPATVDDGVLHLPLGAIEVSYPRGSYAAALRPGSLTIASEGPITASVVDARYTTDGYVVAAEASGIAVAVASPGPIEPGTVIRLALDPTAVALYPPD
ncbi:MAG: ABC transporter ATP-binding protein [Acidimicrobiia bacterium]